MSPKKTPEQQISVISQWLKDISLPKEYLITDPETYTFDFFALKKECGSDWSTAEVINPFSRQIMCWSNLSASQRSRRGSTAGRVAVGSRHQLQTLVQKEPPGVWDFTLLPSFQRFLLPPAEPLLGWISTGCSSTVPPWAQSSPRFTAHLPHTGWRKMFFGLIFKFAAEAVFW